MEYSVCPIVIFNLGCEARIAGGLSVTMAGLGVTEAGFRENSLKAQLSHALSVVHCAACFILYAKYQHISISAN